METTLNFTNINSDLSHGIAQIGQATADDLSDVSEIVSDGVQFGGTAAQISDGGLIYVLFVLGIFLWMVTDHRKTDKAKRQPNRKVVKPWLNASDAGKTKRSSESKGSQQSSMAIHTRIRKWFVGNAGLKPREPTWPSNH